MSTSAAPKTNPMHLWSMTSEDFLAWRQQHDYPRIIAYVKQKLPDFERWMREQDVTDGLLVSHAPATFLKNKRLYLYNILHDEKDEKEMVKTAAYRVGETFFHKNVVKSRKDVLPYPLWYERTYKKRAPEIMVNHKSGRSHMVLQGLELLDLGNCHLNGAFIGHRKLDFVNISDLTLTHCFNNTILEIDFSSASNVTVQGDFPFVQAYQTSFSESMFGRIQNLKLINGRFQDWHFVDCDVNVYASNAVLYRWRYVGEDFDATLTTSDIVDCSFKSLPIRYPIQLNRARVFHGILKRLYSQLGKKKQASDHFYWEKTYERRSYLHVRENHRDAFLARRTTNGRKLVRVQFFFKYLRSQFVNLLWGYGERPARVFLLSIATILLFAGIFCLAPSASDHTRGHFGNALYFSMVTFTTLGYGDISQTDGTLQLLSGLEALLGMSFWGILIAGFTNNAKDD